MRLPLRAYYSITELANAMGVSRQRLYRELMRRAVIEPLPTQMGRGKHVVYMCNLQRACPEMWDSICLINGIAP